MEITYQKLVNKMFADQIKKMMEVYIDDMHIKSLRVEYHLQHLKEAFNVLLKYRMKLNQLKCAFGVKFGKLLDYMVNQEGIQQTPDKIQVLINMRSPYKPKQV